MYKNRDIIFSKDFKKEIQLFKPLQKERIIK